MTRIQQNQTEQIEVFLTDYSNVPITGASPTIKIRRISDDKYLDWDDNTFKATGWTTIADAMTEIDSTNGPGEYKIVFDSSGLSDDNYEMTVDYNAGGIRKQFKGELKVGGYVDNIDIGISTRSTLTAQQVWEYGTRTLTGFGSLVADIWSSATRTLTDPDSYKADVSGIPQAVWEYSTRTLSSFGSLVADIATAVWGAGTRTLTGFGTLVASIWTSATRTLTDPASYKADVSGLATAVALAELVVKVEKNYTKNEKRTFYITTVQIAERNVDVEKYSKEKVEIKDDNDANWDSPIETYWRYYWYNTMGDDQPEKVSGESS